MHCSLFFHYVKIHHGRFLFFVTGFLKILGSNVVPVVYSWMYQFFSFFPVFCTSLPLQQELKKQKKKEQNWPEHSAWSKESGKFRNIPQNTCFLVISWKKNIKVWFKTVIPLLCKSYLHDTKYLKIRIRIKFDSN